MFHTRNILAKSQWMGIAALIVAMIMVLDPVLSLAQEGGSDDKIVIFSSDGDEIEFGGTNSYGDLSGGTQSQGYVESDSGRKSAAGILNEDEIWALVDYDELRSLVDVQSLRSSIDEPALLDSIDRDELRAEIDGKELLAEFDEEDLEDEFIERKLEGECFVIDENGQAIIVDENYTQDSGEETLQDYDEEDLPDFDEDSVEESTGEALEDASEDAANDGVEPADQLSEIISEETFVLEDGREIKSVKVKYLREMVEEHPVDIVKTQLPILGENSPFDFIIDPMNLLYQTSPEGTVEEGASVLFKNTDSEYDFSHRSDMINFINKGNVPVKLIITANIRNPESVPLVGSTYELSGNEPGLFMALADDTGVAAVISSYGDAVIETVLRPVPEGTYVFKYNETTGKYSYTMVEEAVESEDGAEIPETDDGESTENSDDVENPEEDNDAAELMDSETGETDDADADEVIELVDSETSETDDEDSNDDADLMDSEIAEPKEDSIFDSYSFGVVGACNTEADWSGVMSRPIINFSWKVEPILSDWDNLTEQLEAELRARLLEDREEFEVFKLVKESELVEEKLLELLQVKFEELKEKELERLIKEEVLRLALERIAEMPKSDNDNGIGAEAETEVEAEEVSGDEENAGGSTEDSDIVDTKGAETGADEAAESKDTVEITSDGDTILIPETPAPPDAKPPESDGVEFFDSDDN